MSVELEEIKKLLESNKKMYDEVQRMFVRNRDIPQEKTISELVHDLKETFDKELKKQTEYLMCEIKKSNEELRLEMKPLVDVYTKGSNFREVLMAIGKTAGWLVAGYFAVKTLGAGIINWASK